MGNLSSNPGLQLFGHVKRKGQATYLRCTKKDYACARGQDTCWGQQVKRRTAPHILSYHLALVLRLWWLALRKEPCVVHSCHSVPMKVHGASVSFRAIQCTWDMSQKEMIMWWSHMQPNALRARIHESCGIFGGIQSQISDVGWALMGRSDSKRAMVRGNA